MSEPIIFFSQSLCDKISKLIKEDLNIDVELKLVDDGIQFECSKLTKKQIKKIENYTLRYMRDNASID